MSTPGYAGERRCSKSYTTPRDTIGPPSKYGAGVLSETKSPVRPIGAFEASDLIWNTERWSRTPSLNGQLILGFGRLKRTLGWIPGVFGRCPLPPIDGAFEATYRGMVEEIHAHAETRAVIPPNAIVEVNVPPFVALSLSEHGSYMTRGVGGAQAAWADKDGRYILLNFDFVYEGKLPDVRGGSRNVYGRSGFVG